MLPTSYPLIAIYKHDKINDNLIIIIKRLENPRFRKLSLVKRDNITIRFKHKNPFLKI